MHVSLNMRVCVCVCVCERERERDRPGGGFFWQFLDQDQCWKDRKHVEFPGCLIC